MFLQLILRSQIVTSKDRCLPALLFSAPNAAIQGLFLASIAILKNKTKFPSPSPALLSFASPPHTHP
jgi:hypothetical protein